MNNEFAKLEKLKKEYSHLLKMLPKREEELARSFEDEGIPLEKLGERIVFLENEIVKLKEELSSDGVDVETCLKI